MSRIIEEKHTCDRCGMDLSYPRMKMAIKRPITVINRRWTNGTPYGYFDACDELCQKCTDDFRKFIMGKTNAYEMPVLKFEGFDDEKELDELRRLMKNREGQVCILNAEECTEPHKKISIMLGNIKITIGYTPKKYRCSAWQQSENKKGDIL